MLLISVYSHLEQCQAQSVNVGRMLHLAKVPGTVSVNVLSKQQMDL